MLTIQMIQEMVESKDRKGLQEVAKQMGIKANQKTTVMAEEIIKQLEANEMVESTNTVNEVVEEELVNVEEDLVVDAETGEVIQGEEIVVVKEEKRNEKELMNNTYTVTLTQEEYEELLQCEFGKGTVLGNLQARLEKLTADSASEASAPSTPTSEPSTQPAMPASEASRFWIFDFVRADNTMVEFKQKGKTIKVGWSKKDFKFYIYSEDKGARLTSARSVIHSFKRFHNGVHGDIAQIVYHLSRLIKKPSIIVAMEKRAKSQQGVSADGRKENASAKKSSRSKFVPIDPEWLKEYQERMGENYDARNVRHDYELYLESLSTNEADGHVGGER